MSNIATLGFEFSDGGAAKSVSALAQEFDSLAKKKNSVEAAVNSMSRTMTRLIPSISRITEECASMNSAFERMSGGLRANVSEVNSVLASLSKTFDSEIRKITSGLNMLSSGVSRNSRIISNALSSSASSGIRTFVSGADVRSVDSVMRGIAMSIRGAFGARYLSSATKEANKFRVELAQIASLAPELNLSVIEESLMSMPSAMGNATESANALYYAYSSGLRGTEAELSGFVSGASRLAKVIRADVTPTIDAVTTAMNAYGVSIENSAEIFDAMYLIVKYGKARGDQLASSFGQVASTAKVAGLSMNELGASIAAMTKVLPTRNAITFTNNMIAKMIKPSIGASAAARELGIEYGLTALKAEGFTEKLRQIRELSRSNPEYITRLFPDLRGQRAAFYLLGEGWDEYVRILDEMENKQGAADEAFNAFSSDINVQLEALPETFRKIKAAAGDFITQFLTFNGRLLPVIRGFNSMESSSQKLVGSAAALAAGYLTLSGAMKAYVLVKNLSVKASHDAAIAIEAERVAREGNAVAARHEMTEIARRNAMIRGVANGTVAPDVYESQLNATRKATMLESTLMGSLVSRVTTLIGNVIGVNAALANQMVLTSNGFKAMQMALGVSTAKLAAFSVAAAGTSAAVGYAVGQLIYHFTPLGGVVDELVMRLSGVNEKMRQVQENNMAELLYSANVIKGAPERFAEILDGTDRSMTERLNAIAEKMENAGPQPEVRAQRNAADAYEKAMREGKEIVERETRLNSTSAYKAIELANALKIVKGISPESYGIYGDISNEEDAFSVMGRLVESLSEKMRVLKDQAENARKSEDEILAARKDAAAGMYGEIIDKINADMRNGERIDWVKYQQKLVESLSKSQDELSKKATDAAKAVNEATGKLSELSEEYVNATASAFEAVTRETDILSRELRDGLSTAFGEGLGARAHEDAKEAYRLYFAQMDEMNISEARKSAKSFLDSYRKADSAYKSRMNSSMSDYQYAMYEIPLKLAESEADKALIVASRAKAAKEVLDKAVLESEKTNATKNYISALVEMRNAERRKNDETEKAILSTRKLAYEIGKFSETAYEGINAFSVDAVKLRSRQFQEIGYSPSEYSADASYRAEENRLKDEIAKLAEELSVSSKSRYDEAESGRSDIQSMLESFKRESDQSIDSLRTNMEDIKKQLTSGKCVVRISNPLVVKDNW